MKMELKSLEEILEFIWTKEEMGQVNEAELFNSGEPKIDKAVLEELAQSNLISLKDGKVTLIGAGKETAAQVIRLHRLAERLFSDILDLGPQDLEENACTFEHCLSTAVSEAICTLLGHPRECPHGKPIPPGQCCRKAKKQLESVVVSLSELKSGMKGKVAYITSRKHPLLAKLASLGIFPGVEIKVHQTFPSFVIQIDQTQVALDKEILKDIYVRKI